MIIKRTILYGVQCDIDPKHDYLICRIIDSGKQTTGFGLYFGEDELPTIYYSEVDKKYEVSITNDLFNENGKAPFLPWMRGAIKQIECIISEKDPQAKYEKIVEDQSVKDRLGIANI